MKEMKLLAQNINGFLFTWVEEERVAQYRVEGLSDTFNYQLIANTNKNQLFIPREKAKNYIAYRVQYMMVDALSQQSFLVDKTAPFYLNQLESIKLVAMKSYVGGALSFYSEKHYDLYRLYRLNDNGMELLEETEDCHITSSAIKVGETYQVEGYQKEAEGNLVLVAISEPSVCQFRLPFCCEKPILSVVVPVYNCERFLSRTVDSILLSSFEGLELILVNDGSRDKSGEICDWYQTHYANVSVIHKKNGGVCTARNAGMDLAKGEFLAFVDNDDLVHPYMYQKLYEAIETEHSDIAIAQTISRKESNQYDIVLSLSSVNETITNYSYAEMINAKGTNKNIHFVAIWNKIVRTNIARKVRFFDEMPYYEDTAYTNTLYTYINKFTMVKGAYYIWDKRKQKTVGTATNSYKAISPALLWHYYLLTLLSPLFQGNMQDIKVAKMCAFDVMKKALEVYQKQTNQQVKDIFSSILKYYVKTYQISFEQFQHSQNSHLKTLYSAWQEIEQNKVAESNGWDEMRKLKKANSRT